MYCNIFVFFCINLRLSIAMWAIGQVLPTHLCDFSWSTTGLWTRRRHQT